MHLWYLLLGKQQTHKLCYTFLPPEAVTDIALAATKFLFFDLNLKLFSTKHAFILIKYRMLFYPHLTAFIRAINSLTPSRFISKLLATLAVYRIRAYLLYVHAFIGLYKVPSITVHIISLAIIPHFITQQIQNSTNFPITHTYISKHFLICFCSSSIGHQYLNKYSNPAIALNYKFVKIIIYEINHVIMVILLLYNI